MYVIARKIGRENKQSKYEQEIAKTEVSGKTTKYFMHAEIFDISCYLDKDKIGREKQKSSLYPKTDENRHNEISMPKGPKIGRENFKRPLCNHWLAEKWAVKPINNVL